VCAFNLTSIERAFNGPFKTQRTSSSAWEPQNSPESHNIFECRQPASPATQQLLDSSRHQLMDLAVQPTTLRPLYESKLERFTHVAVDVLDTKIHKWVPFLHFIPLLHLSSPSRAGQVWSEANSVCPNLTVAGSYAAYFSKSKRQQIWRQPSITKQLNALHILSLHFNIT